MKNKDFTLILYNMFGSKEKLGCVMTDVIRLYKECGGKFVTDPAFLPDYIFVKKMLQELDTMELDDKKLFMTVYSKVLKTKKDMIEPELLGLKQGVEEAEDLWDLMHNNTTENVPETDDK